MKLAGSPLRQKSADGGAALYTYDPVGLPGAHHNRGSAI